MEILGKFQIVEDLPALHSADLEALIISDLHLGLEALMADSGMYMPKFQLEEFKEDISKINDNVDSEIKNLIVCGDIKHEFSETSYQEKQEVEKFVEFASELFENICFVKGNHDNYLIYVVEKYPNVELRESFTFDEVMFVHGHEKPEDIGFEVNYLVIGHEHPALSIKDSVGSKEKIRCFLYGEMWEGTNIIVLPAFSKLASGSQVNHVRREELLSPILKDLVDINEMKAIGVDKEAGVFEYPKLKEFKKIR